MNLQNQIIALWVVVLLLIGYILFLQQKRSYFVPGTQTEITMMELQEFSYLDEKQKEDYKKALKNNAPKLKASKTNMFTYQSNLTAVMQVAFQQTTNVPLGKFRIVSNSGKYLGRSNMDAMTLSLMTSNVVDTFIYTSTNDIQHVQSGMNVMFAPTGAPIILQSKPNPVTLTKTSLGQYILRQSNMNTDIILDGSPFIKLVPL